jgi:GntR family phosphonate transport system transcriptional regulator
MPCVGPSRNHKFIETSDNFMTQLERRSGTALWRQIERILEQDIEAKTFAPTNQLPTEKELAERFGVNRHTLRRAMAALEDKGLVQIKQGHGTFVSEDILDYLIGERTRFSENVSRQRRHASGTLIATKTAPAEERIAERLKLGRGATCLSIETVRYLDDRPISFAEHFFDAHRFDGLAAHFEEHNSMTGALKHYGIIDYTRGETIIIARMPNGYEAHHLIQPRTRPILVSESVDLDPSGHPFAVNISRFAADRVQFVIRND